jgi:hypothetical protein
VATDRVKRALEHRKLELDPLRFQVIAARLGKPNLGLDEDLYLDLARDTDIVIHVSNRRRIPGLEAPADSFSKAAWAVHFGSRLESFEKDHIQGRFPHQSQHASEY